MKQPDFEIGEYNLNVCGKGSKNIKAHDDQMLGSEVIAPQSF